MVKVAIAGGSGMLGTKLVAEFAKQSKHEAVVLTRKPSLLSPLPTLTVDYTSPTSLETTLTTHSITTVICTFGITSTSLSISQTSLIQACAASQTVKRFIPTSFAIPYPRSGIKFDVVYDEKILEDLNVTELPGHKRQYGKFPKERLLPFLAVFERWMVEGRCEVSREGSLNEMFPEMKTLGVREMVETFWMKSS